LLRRAAPDLRPKTWLALLDANPGSFLITPGTVYDGGLRESSIGGVSDDMPTLKLWRSIVRFAKAGMHTGAVVRNPRTGAEQERPHHRHTQGAHVLASEGLPMRAVAGWVEYVFTDTSRPSRVA
jgi:hypothetical protein